MLRWGAAAPGLGPVAALIYNGDLRLLWLLAPAALCWLAGHRLYERRTGAYRSLLAAALLDRLQGQRGAHTALARASRLRDETRGG